jgi:hypothetical protein
MSRTNLRRRVATIEARSHRPPIAAHELAQLIVDASSEVLDEIVRVSHPLLNNSAASEGRSEMMRCSRCGHAGSFSKPKPPKSAPKVTPWDPESESVTVRQLREGFDRATLIILEDAINLASFALDPSAELLMADCLICGHPKPQLVPEPGSASPQTPI